CIGQPSTTSYVPEFEEDVLVKEILLINGLMDMVYLKARAVE
ncbi:hypothetical protein NPIL_142801, partial [Nephila pilipes]